MCSVRPFLRFQRVRIPADLIRPSGILKCIIEQWIGNQARFHKQGSTAELCGDRVGCVKFGSTSEQDWFCEVRSCWNLTSFPRSPVRILLLLLDEIPVFPKSSPSSIQPPRIPPRPPVHSLSLGCLSANTPFSSSTGTLQWQNLSTAEKEQMKDKLRI